MKRAGQPEEVASVVGFLASEKASYLSGQIIGVNGAMA
jgi:3-oxoacyl-[acyl-carrier protein] reductase